MLKYIIAVFLIYFLYRFIVNFLIPVGRTTREIKRKMNEFQNRMQEQQGFGPQQQPETEKKPAKAGDYIDFEEVN
jgi:Sec-independent protein translocase protein TatA